MAGILFIISAPSGSGKSTLVSEVRKQLSGIEFSVSWTTRAPRGSEQDGREYHFTTREEFERMIAAGEFLEHAEVFGNSTAPRGSRLKRRARAGHDLLLDIDVQGAAQVRATMPEAVSIFVLPPNPKVLRTRLRNRSRAEGVVNEAELYRRLSEASKEIENYRELRLYFGQRHSGPGGGAIGGDCAGRAFLPQRRSHCIPVAQGVGGGRGLPPDQRAGTAETRAGGLWHHWLLRPADIGL